MRDSVKGGALTEITFFILLSLYEPNHGYGIMKFVEEKTQGRLVLGAGTLYGAINALEKRNWIKRTERVAGEDDRKKTYVIAEKGKKVAKMELERLKNLIDTAEKIMGGLA